jgi:hypothetical protein
VTSLEFAAECIKNLAWPVAAGSLFWRYRKQLDTLADRFSRDAKSLSAFGGTLDIGKQSEEERKSEIDADLIGGLPRAAAAPASATQPILASDQQRSLGPGEGQEMNEGAVARLTEFLASEELVIRSFEQRWDIQIQREAAVTVGNRRLLFDGMAYFGRELRVIEARMISGLTIPEVWVEQQIARAESLQSSTDARVKLYLCPIFTTTLDGIVESVSHARNVASDARVSVVVEAFRTRELLLALAGLTPRATG